LIELCGTTLSGPNGSCFTVETVNGQTRVVYLYLDEAIRERRQDAEMTFAALGSGAPRHER
jgi:hypothetical protein